MEIDKFIEKIYIIRGIPVMIDRDLAAFYGITTKRLNQQVERNQDRFPADFCFRLEDHEVEDLRSQNATAIQTKTRVNPIVFSEIGAYAVSGIIKSETAAKISVVIYRAFVILKKNLKNKEDLYLKIKQMEKKYDMELDTIWKKLHILDRFALGDKKQISNHEKTVRSNKSNTSHKSEFHGGS